MTFCTLTSCPISLDQEPLGMGKAVFGFKRRIRHLEGAVIRSRWQLADSLSIVISIEPSQLTIHHSGYGTLLC